jgi:hypothetical protein
VTQETPIVVGLTAVILAVTDEVPRVLVVRRVAHPLATPAQLGQPAADLDSPDTLPFGPFEPQHHRTLQDGMRRWVQEQTGLTPRYVEQLYTFGNRYRDTRELYGGPRVVSVGYLALARETPVAGSGEAEWRDWYSFLPWEDWRDGRPALYDRVIRPGLDAWVAATSDGERRRLREEQVGIAFGFADSAGRAGARTLERYELLYEAGLVAESVRDRRQDADATGHDAGTMADPATTADALRLGAPMALDNRRILATALGRLRGKIAYRPIVFDLLPEDFTLFRLQRVAEALAGMRLHKQNFRRMVLSGGLVEPTGQFDNHGRGRPAELFRFRRDVVAARPETGISLPGARVSDPRAAASNCVS